uniref:Uncharacterized protein n=1 Tax=Anguilla anguilla TaxID=7936 RepID=A0A0E9U6H5_ANGAN
MMFVRDESVLGEIVSERSVFLREVSVSGQTVPVTSVSGATLSLRSVLLGRSVTVEGNSVRDVSTF